MSLRVKYIGFVTLLHGLFFILSLQFLPQSPLIFLAVEGVILISLFISVRLFQSFIAPLELIRNGVETIRARDFNTRLLPVGQVEMDQLIQVYNQMIDQMRQERIKAQEQEFLLEKLIEATPAGIVILELDGNIRDINPVAREMLALTSPDLDTFRFETSDDPFIRQVGTLGPGETQTFTKRDGRSYKCHRSQFLDRGFHRDFLIIEEMTEELLQREKQTYGKIIRFMSHEISNSIGAINSILNSLLNYQDQLEAEDMDDFSQAIKVATNRNDHLNEFMQHYAQIVRLPHPTREAQDLHRILHEMETLFSTQSQAAGVTWEWDLTEGPFLCHVDGRQMEQVLTNIIKNAIEAMDSGGILGLHTELAPRKSLRITDTGSGFTPEAAAMLFTPFFSTKKNGQGVGLIMIRDILRNHDLEFSLERIDKATTQFQILFE